MTFTHRSSGSRPREALDSRYHNCLGSMLTRPPFPLITMSSLRVPESLTEEHHELFHELKELASEKNETGKAVRELLAILEPHFEKEEESAMPLLGALRPLSEGKALPDPSVAMTLHARFVSEYPEMLEEHSRVKELIEHVRSTAAKDGKPRAAIVMDELALHAKVEEEVLYPAALLVGAFAKAGVKVSTP